MAGSASISGSGQSRLDAIKRSGSGAIPPSRWYVHLEGAPQGPFDLAEMREMLRIARVNAETSVNRIGSSDWAALRQDAMLAPYLAPREAPIPVHAVAAAPRRVVVDQRVDIDDILRQHGAGHIGKPAGFWIRACAIVLDSFIVWLLSIPVQYMITHLVGNYTHYNLRGALFSQLLILICYTAYFVLFNCSDWQATPGKRVLGIYIRRKDSHQMTIAQAIGRYFAMSFSYLLFCIGFMMAGWNSEKKALHDMMAGTRVVHGKL